MQVLPGLDFRASYDACDVLSNRDAGSPPWQVTRTGNFNSVSQQELNQMKSESEAGVLCVEFRSFVLLVV